MIINLAALRERFAFNPPKLSSQFDEGDPRRLRHLNLEQQKNRARELLREWHSVPDATHPAPTLSDAQYAIAKEHGFTHWAALKAHIEQGKTARNELKNGTPDAPDGNERVLHIRCGSDIQHTLAVAGFNGDFLAFYDPYVHGPVPQTESLEAFLQIRARYISSTLHPDYQQVLDDLRQQYAALDQAHTYEAVYLWFEHDPFDQLILARLLDFFADDERRPNTLKLISISHYPGVKIFNGIGQLPPEALRVLWREFREVTAAQLVLGTRAWSTICAPTPQAMLELITSGTPELPTMAHALQRHLRQLPSVHNGLSLSENLTLQILNEKGGMNAGRLFGWYTNHYEPLSFMGDSGYWQLLQVLATAQHPAIHLDKQGIEPSQWQVALSEAGRQLLAGQADWIALNGIDSWVGGIHLCSRIGNIYRYQ
jgi:hypothetical protein